MKKISILIFLLGTQLAFSPSYNKDDNNKTPYQVIVSQMKNTAHL
jgi:hypothetical protein